MESRALRLISKAVVAAGTAGAIATVCWLLNRILDDDELKCIDVATSYLDLKATTTFDDYNTTADYQQQQEYDTDDSFVMLPIPSESDDEDAADYFTPHYDACILSVTVETLVDPRPDVQFDDVSPCRLCRTAVESCGSIGDGIQLGEKPRTLSFSNTETSHNGGMLSLSSKCSEEEEIQRLCTCSKSQQRLYVRL